VSATRGPGHPSGGRAFEGRRRRAALAILACAAFVALLAPALSARPTGRAGPRSGETLRIAVFVPSRGDFSAHNQLIANGAKIAVSELSGVAAPSQGMKLDLMQRSYAPGADPSALVRAVKAAGVSAVILPCDVDDQPRFAQAAAGAKLLMLTPCDPDPSVDARYAMEWPVGMAGNVEVGQIVGYAYRENGFYAYLLTSNGPSYVTELANYFRSAAKADHVKIVGQSAVSLAAPDIAGVAAAIKRSDARAIFTPIFSPYLEPIIAGLRARGVRIPVYGTDGVDADLNVARYTHALDNDMIFASFGFARPASRQFFTDYHLTFHHSAADSSFPELGYETIRVLVLAASKADSTDPSAIDATFARGFTDTGVALADITYPGHGQQVPVTAAGVVRIINGIRVAMFASYPVGVVPIPKP
jgi:branched-chain amino acid transport system substrate-binding protein